MGHYEERLERDLARIRKQVRTISQLVDQALGGATRAALTLDRDSANDTILGDLRINRETRELDHLCHGFVARHLPSAGHLRYVSSVLRLNIALERIGDYAETISRTAVQATTVPSEHLANDLEMMADQARRLFLRATKAFDEQDAARARETIANASQMTSTFDDVYAHLIRAGEAGTQTVRDLFGFLATFNRLERVIHQAKNICEETLFAATGETKPSKSFDVLFVDARNDGASQLAEHFARKAFADGGTFQSAGWDPAEQVDPGFARFAEGHGLDFSDALPRSLASLPEKLSEFEIVIALQPGIEQHIDHIPFHTVLLKWQLDDAADPEATYRQLAPEIRELMEVLRGEEA